MIGKTIGQYEILEHLGGGGMGVVYTARDTRLNRLVALKFLPVELASDEDANARFVQEAQAASALDHPNICTVHEIGEASDGRTFIAMAHYDGQTLKHRLLDGPIDSDEAGSIFRQVLEGLGAAHKKGIVHRDIKPANIMLTVEGRVKVLDFGLAKLSVGLDLTKTGSTVGTTYYMSPEQLRGEDVDHRTDLWSAGVVLYEMLTGRRPFEGEYEQAVAYVILNDEPAEPAKDVPQPLIETLDSVLRKNREERPTSAEEILAFLEGHTGSDSQSFLSGKRVSSNDAKYRWPKYRWGVGLAAAAMTIAALVWFQTQPPSSDVELHPVPAIAILPFQVDGDDELEYLGEGLVHLLGNKLDGMGDLSSVDANSILSFVDRREGRVDVQLGKDAAAEFGATGFILGSLIRGGNLIRLSASLYDQGGNKQATREQNITADSLLLPAIDRLAIGLISSRLDLQGRSIASVAAITSASFDALKHYLRGEAFAREGDFERAIESLLAATELDSTFSLAWYGLAQSAGWGGGRYQELTTSAIEAAVRHSSGLPDRIRVQIEALALWEQDRWQDAERLLRDHLRLYPKDPEAWYNLGDIVFHNYPRIGKANQESEPAFERAASIDPANGAYSAHINELRVVHGRFDDLTEYGDTLYYQELAVLLKGRLEIDTLVPPLQVINTDLGQVEPRAGFVREAISARQPDKARAVQSHLNTDIDVGFAVSQTMALATGRFQEALRKSPLPREHVIALWIPRLLLFKSFSNQELQQMRSAVAEWDTLSHPLSLHWSPRGRLYSSELRYPYRVRELRAFASGMLSWALEDAEGLDKAARSLRPQSPMLYDSTLAASLHNILHSLDARDSGKLHEALAFAENTTVRRSQGISEFPYYSEKMGRFLRADILLALGRHSEAIEWFNTFEMAGSGSIDWPAFLAPSIVKRAVSYEALGDYVNALDHYRLFIEFWKDADTDLQPSVDEARSSIARIQLELAREPASR